MNKRWKKIVCFLLICILTLGRKQAVLAEETATIIVQEKELQSNGNVTVEIYIKNIKNLGGMDFSLIYDAEKLTYVDSGLQGIFAEGFGETNHVEKENMVRIVSIYQDGISEDGMIATITFQLKAEKMYLPTLQVNDLVDASLEIKDIPFEVQYQQANGTQSTTPEQGAESEENENQGTGDESVESTTENISSANTENIQETDNNVNENGTSEEMQNSAGVQEEGEHQTEQQEGSGIGESEEMEGKGGEEEKQSEENADVNSSNNIIVKEQKTMDMRVFVVLVVMIGSLVGIYIIKKKKG